MTICKNASNVLHMQLYRSILHSIKYLLKRLYPTLGTDEITIKYYNLNKQGSNHRCEMVSYL